jgi:hypothetical protein
MTNPRTNLDVGTAPTRNYGTNVVIVVGLLLVVAGVVTLSVKEGVQHPQHSQAAPVVSQSLRAFRRDGFDERDGGFERNDGFGRADEFGRDDSFRRGNINVNVRREDCFNCGFGRRDGVDAGLAFAGGAIVGSEIARANNNVEIENNQFNNQYDYDY